MEIVALDDATGNSVVLRACSGHAPTTIFDGLDWLPVIAEAPKSSYSLWADGQPKPLDVSYGTVGITINPVLGSNEWPRFSFEGRIATVWRGEADQPFASFRKIFTGHLGPLVRDNDQSARFTLLGPEAALVEDLLTDTYSGTGGVNGDADLMGTYKPFSIGYNTSVEPVLMDAKNWVFQVHGYGACAINAVYENVVSLGAASATVTTYADLIALNLTDGQWAACPAQGLFRLKNEPTGTITADVGSASTCGAVSRALMLRAGLSTDRIDASVGDTGRAYYLYATAQMSILDIVRDAAFAASRYLIADGSGVFAFAPFLSTKVPGELRSDRSSEPLVRTDTITGEPVTLPAYRVRVGHTRVWHTLATTDISPAVSEISANQAALDAKAQAAQDAADLAAAEAALARAEYASMVADGILDRAEKQRLTERFEGYTAERPVNIAEANNQGITAERDAYDAAYIALSDYLQGLVPAYNDTLADTVIDASTYIARLVNYDLAKAKLLAAIANKAAQTAAWGSVTGPGKPDDNATVGAPPGTPVGDRPAEEVIDQLDGNTVAIKQLPDLVTNMLIEPIDRLSALHLSYGAINMRKSIALADGNAVAIRDLRTYVDEAGAVVAEDLLNLTSRVGSNEAGLLELSQTYASETEATASQLLDMIARTNDNEAAIIEERRVRTTQDESMATSLGQLGARVGNNEGKIEDVRAATADLDSATATRFSAMETRVAGTETTISSLQSTVNDGSTATANSLDQLGVRITDETGAREGAIQTERQARADADGALSGRIDTISSEINAPGTGLRSVIQTVQQTAADANGTRAQEITSLQSRLNNTNGQVGASLENRMATLASIDGKLQSEWTIKVAQDVNGQQYVAGGGLVMENGVSSISWLADSFRIMTPGTAPKQVFYADANGVFMDGATIGRLTVDTLQIKNNAITANQVVTSGDTYIPAGGSAYFLQTGFMTIGDGNGGSGIIDVSFTVDATTDTDGACLLEMWTDTGSGWTLVNSIIHGITTDDGDTVSRVYGALKTVVSGSQVRVQCRCTSGTYTARSVARIIYMRNITMTLMGAKR